MPQRRASDPSSTLEQLGGRAVRAWFEFAATGLAIIAAALHGSGLYARDIELNVLAAQARTGANLKVLLSAVLENPRALPLLLSQDEQVHDALARRDAVAIGVLNRELKAA
ncbi:hypothetical protein [Mesorhizobium sp. 43Arga]